MNPNAGDTLISRPVRSAVIVAAELSDVGLLAAALSAKGLHVTVTGSFINAKALLTAKPPDLLITDLRLGEYNGLHLVIRGKATRPEMAALVLSSLPDVVLELEAERLGATFVLTPASTEELTAGIFRTLHRRDDDAPIRPPYERRTGERRTAVDSIASDAERRIGDRRRAALVAGQPTQASI